MNLSVSQDVRLCNHVHSDEIDDITIAAKSYAKSHSITPWGKAEIDEAATKNGLAHFEHQERINAHCTPLLQRLGRTVNVRDSPDVLWRLLLAPRRGLVA